MKKRSKEEKIYDAFLVSLSKHEKIFKVDVGDLDVFTTSKILTKIKENYNKELRNVIRNERKKKLEQLYKKYDRTF